MMNCVHRPSIYFVVSACMQSCAYLCCCSNVDFADIFHALVVFTSNRVLSRAMNMYVFCIFNNHANQLMFFSACVLFI